MLRLLTSSSNTPPCTTTLHHPPTAASQIVEALQEKLYELQQAGPEVRPGPDVLEQYQAAVRAISSQLQPPQLPAYCWRVSTQDRLAGVQAAAQGGGGGSSSSSSSANHNTQAQASRSKQPGRCAAVRAASHLC